MDEILECLEEFGLEPTIFVVPFEYDEEGEEPEAITKAYNLAVAMGLNVKNEYGALVFRSK